MTVFSLKILAMASMLCDHLGYFLGAGGYIGNSLYTVMRLFGRRFIKR